MPKAKAPTLRQFQDRFPTEDSCLEHLMRVRFGDRHDCGKCGREARFYRVKARRAYACEHCGGQVHPTAGTPFDRTRTPLRDWFFVMFQFCASPNGVAAKEVERQLGVTYKTAWRMCHMIREYMGALDGSDPIGGEGETVQVDETSIGGHIRTNKKGGGLRNKKVVVGMPEQGGDVVTRVVPDRKSGTLLPLVCGAAPFYTDEWLGYGGLPVMGYRHATVNHSADQYVCPTTSATVNAIESFWAQLKRGINGTHIHVSAKHLPKYLGKFEYRWNMRQVLHLLFDRMLASFSR